MKKIKDLVQITGGIAIFLIILDLFVIIWTFPRFAYTGGWVAIGLAAMLFTCLSIDAATPGDDDNLTNI